MPLRVCPVEGCGRTMRTSETILLVSEHGAEYKRVCQRCARKATRILAAHVAAVCKGCGEEPPRLGARCGETLARLHAERAGKAIAARIRAAADAYEKRWEHATSEAIRMQSAEYVCGLRYGADMAEAAGSVPVERTESDGAEQARR